MNDSDHTDLSVILNQPNMTTFLKSQKMALERNPHGRRWDKDIVRLCLTLWCRSPRGYNELRSSKFTILPSQTILQRYKNTVDQEAGINKNVLHWMKNGCVKKIIPP